MRPVLSDGEAGYVCKVRGEVEVVRPERLELPAFWFVDRSSKTSKCRYWYRLRTTRHFILPLIGRKLDGTREVNPFRGTNR